MPPAQRPIKRLLVANRGEIAIRIVHAARELPSPPETFGLYTDNDSTHIGLGRPTRALRIPSPAAYMDISYLIDLVRTHQIDAVHPGYGFLSESAEFSRRMWEEANAVVIGPGWEILDQTGDKLKAKALAEACAVPVLRAMKAPTGRVDDVRTFARQVGYPVMIKAVDGGGGRGIRLAETDDGLQNAVERCIGESPSRTVFAEEAAVKGFKHIEVQIIGDGTGRVTHLWERDCSVQRRFQKIVEVAPAPVKSRRVIANVIEAAVRMARRIRYLGLGTWEFLVNPSQQKFFFLEINPRLQVEHTITESIAGVDLVREQLLLAQGAENGGQPGLIESGEADKPPRAFSIQLRLCAEDPNANFALAIGKVADVVFPTGNGVRVDSHLSKGSAVGADFDNMLAKIIVTASGWPETIAKAQRALADTKIVGVKTNLNLLRAILLDREFQSGAADTKWLEMNIGKLVESGEHVGRLIESASSGLPRLPSASSAASSIAPSSILLRKGDAWSLVVADATTKSNRPPAAHHLSIDRVMRNEFPDALVADVSYTVAGSKTGSYHISLAATTSSADGTSSTHRRGDPSNKLHIVLPLSGKLIEVLVDEGETVEANQVIAFVKQMKMELEVRAPRAGTIGWVIDLENEDGDDVAEGVLLAEYRDDEARGRAGPERTSKL